ncbi:DUF2306 domain-containing protein [Planctomicrobium sp. SH664]|uniref:DUF2306 domain-containing protein n=1 Tax=Planctomicrobium sp. SH664 TaxID=3448125 RepID=UPI003F5B6547
MESRPSQLPPRHSAFRNVIRVLAVLVVAKTTVAVLLSYRDYFPPQFNRGFLQGREDHFYGVYHLAFSAHVLAGPLSLVLGLLLINGPLRVRFPAWHRRLGRLQGIVVLLFLVPGGLVMSFYSAAGPWAGLGLFSLGVATAVCMLLGWRSALQRQFSEHRCWMVRCFALLMSAVVIRVLGGLGTLLLVQSEWYDVANCWISWLLPLVAAELACRHRGVTGFDSL